MSQPTPWLQWFLIGDCLAPSTIAAAVYAGHRAAREMDAGPTGDIPFLREVIQLA